MILQYLFRLHLRYRPMVWLEITPPAAIAKTPEATEQFFSVVHGIYATRPVKEKLLKRSPVMSFEITSTKKDGIRYVVHVEQARSHAIQKAITAYVPDAKVKEISIENDRSDEVLEFKETGHYVLPLTLTSAFAQHDPLAYVTNAMTKLRDDEQLTMQLVISPIELRGTSSLAHKILRNEDILSSARSRTPFWLQRLSNAMLNALWGTANLASEAYHGTTYDTYTTKSSEQASAHKTQVLKGQKPARSLSSFELEIMESMHRKVTQPLFHVNLRILARGHRAKDHVNELRAAFGGYSVPLYQSLKAKTRLPLLHTHRHKLSDERLPSLSHRNGIVLSAAEIAGLYHFPSSKISQTDNLITSLSRTLPAPVSLKSGKQLGIFIGENHHHGIMTPIGLTEAERERHMYVIGGTGNGKTTMLFYGILQDIQNGKGVTVIDPHGDLAERILRYIPPERINDVIYINPDDLTHPIGVNLLELPPNLSEDNLLREKDLITEAAISVLRKIFSEDDSGGHRIEYVLRNAIQTALTLEDPTLFTIFKLLNNAKYRRKIVKNLEDQNLKDFWDNELGKAGEFQRVKMAAGITAKIGRFLFSASARRMLEQPKSTINFEDILASQKIVICNFSKGLLGEDTSALFGTTMLAKLQTAALRRARMTQDERLTHYLYVDEFQNFATMSFVQMLSEARKYKLFLTMAEQSTSQQDQQRLVDIILANVGTVVCFRSGSPSDERLMLPLFSPYIQQGEIANLPAYSYYVRIAAVHAQEPMSGVTVVLREIGSDAVAKSVIQSSQQLYAKRIEEITLDDRTTETAKAAPAKSPGKQQRIIKRSKKIKATKLKEELSATKSI